ncbi:hypothetical protein BG36_04965 [Aquamicrobium defluvii]|uniref:3-hydroxyacyl-CoA dehydrogenase-like protein n=1 Tax=Aquamicrobium defluvii TaxID=69279 RepID=A0A011ULS6_9HYPH|nr:3-hydroxyacyl-CoA dehydrogenase family protein [Aquamicrobium defluvii]EXL06853.1 hypothetical protein BG36_04965 [Aquamicrobium defluvii]EZQ15880.1 hypothetical protein CF98_09765 [Halopseudomonas bauzanensis]TDR35994.1 3-hydroxyacyl-CoA dehydrogenase-like protein [Aquamicrobium defluvii]
MQDLSAAALKRGRAVIESSLAGQVKKRALADAGTEAVTELARAIGKSPHASSDGDGFVVNRLLVPFINEAINCAHEGVATPQDIDSMMMPASITRWGHWHRAASSGWTWC